MSAIFSIIAFGRRTPGAVLLLALFISSWGCDSGPRFDFTGKWLGRRKLVGAPGANPDVLSTLNEVKITIKPNDRFEMLYSGLPANGNVSIHGDEATLTVTDTLTRTETPESLAKVYAPFHLKGQADGTIVFTDPKADGESPTSLKRIATGEAARP